MPSCLKLESVKIQEHNSLKDVLARKATVLRIIVSAIRMELPVENSANVYAARILFKIE